MPIHNFIAPLIGSSGQGGGYVIEGSANFADAGANHLSWTPAGTGDSRTVMTVEAVFKLFSLATDQHIFSASDGAGNNIERLYIDATGNLHYEIFVGGVTVVHYETTALFRDFSAWYQVVVIRNGNTVTLYVNGTAVTAFDTSDAPAGDNGMFGYTVAHYIGRKPWTTSGYLDLAIARLTYQDGVAASISDYGEAVGNGWSIADASSLSLGTNGVQITGGTDMAAGTLTRSGTAHSVTKTGTITATNDSPTDDATNGYGNFDHWNPLSSGGNGSTFSNGNNTWSDASGSGDAATGTIAVSSGKWICEFEIDAVTAGLWLGVWGMETQTASTPFKSWDSNNDIAGDHGTWVIKPSTGYTVDGDGQGDPGTNQSLSTWTATDRLTIAIDMDQGAGSNKMWIAKNGTWENSGDPDGGTGAIFTNLPERVVFVVGNRSSGTDTVTMRADSATWEDSPSNATTFKDLCTANLPATTVTDPSAYFKTVTYTTTGSDGLQVTGFTDAEGNDVTPDFVWQKNRDQADRPLIYDVLRGAGNRLSSDRTQAEASESDTLKTFDAGGVTLGNDATNALGINHTASENCVMWMLKAGGAGSSNIDGDLTSTVSVADHNGFAIIKHTNTSGDYTVGHGMGQAPDMLIQKGLGTQGWLVWTADLGVDGYLALHATDAVANPAGDPWSDTSPTSSVFTIAGTTWYGGSSFDIVTYAFARTPGLIAIGSYTANGNADGPYVVVDDGGVGFRPAFVLFKDYAGAANWQIMDAVRDPYNPIGSELYPNTSGAESTAGAPFVDFTANGFKCRATGDPNNSGRSYIYLAFAEYPFGGDGVEQARAR